MAADRLPDPAPECRYCGMDADGLDAMGRPACEAHIEQVDDDLGLGAEEDGHGTDYPHGDTVCAGCHACQPERFPNKSAAYCGCRVCDPTGASNSLLQAPVSAAVSPAEPPEAKRELTEYEKGYLDGVLAYSYRGGDGEVYVGKSRLTTYKAAALGFLRKQGIDTKGWNVNVR